jgi:hypothetical protein
VSVWTKDSVDFGGVAPADGPNWSYFSDIRRLLCDEVKVDPAFSAPVASITPIAAPKPAGPETSNTTKTPATSTTSSVTSTSTSGSVNVTNTVGKNAAGAAGAGAALLAAAAAAAVLLL